MEQDVKRNKKRDIIKNVAIIFLSVMLLLTFFSNTIMNYSLPEVSTRYVMGENISNRIRGTGVVESVDPYNVIVNETRTVSSVAVYVDEYVEKDAVIYTLSGKESEELDQAKAEKDAAQIEYEKMILNGGISSARLKEIQAGKVQTLEQSQAALDAFQSKIDSNQTTVDNLSKQIAILEQTGVDASDESKALASAQKKLNNARVDLSKKQAAYDALADRADTDEEKIAAKAALDAAQTLVWELEAKVANAQLALEQKLNSTEIADQIKNLNVQKINADTALTEAKEGKQNLLDKILLEMDVYDTYKKLQEKKDLVKELEEEALGGEVVAPVAGKIVSLSYTAGEDTVPGEVAAVIQVEGKGYMLSFSAGVRQAATVNIGDEVEVQDGWYYGDVTARLSAIKTDKENPKEKRILVFELSGNDVSAGDNLTLSVGQRNMYYDLVVPNSAIREDNNGKFILIVETRFAPFGNRYVAKRVDVEVLASDNTNSAISGALEGYEYVITGATRPIEAGDQVRLAEEISE